LSKLERNQAIAMFDNPTVRALTVAIRSMVGFTLICGIAYTLFITIIGQLAFEAKADGSLVHDATGAVVGSSLIGQQFSDEAGNPLPQYFQPRPSAAGSGYDGGASSGSNYGPENETLIETIAERSAQIAAFNGVEAAAIPADAVTASGSGLDPHISETYAMLQVQRVANARGIDVDLVRELVADHVDGRGLSFLGEPTVNVLMLNLALDALKG
jgi:K+-transporting ATPase ATPase C chain